jgi:AraC-like DNA-binding protein
MRPHQPAPPCPGRADARVSTILVRAVIEAVEACGISVEDFLLRAGVSSRQFETPYGWVALSVLDRLIEHAVAITRDEAFGLHWSERSPMVKFDLLSTATAYAPTLREALSCVLRFQTLLCERAELELAEGERSALLRFTPVASTELAARVRSEHGIACLVRLLRHVGAPDAALLRVSFVHPAPPYASEHARLLGSRVCFDQAWSGIEVDARWFDRRVHHANAELHQLLTQQAQEVLSRVQTKVAYADRLRAHCQRAFPRIPHVRDAARALALSERSLRRRLSEEGYTYSALVDEQRRRRAQQLLRDPARPIKEIACAVGFTSVAAFFRAFKRWTGESPTDYRRYCGAAMSA